MIAHQDLDQTQPRPRRNGSEAGNFGLEGWFCIRTQLKQEHIAASQLRQVLAVEVFLPRIRFKRSTKLGPMWVTEALFPNYLFARFNLGSHLRRVQNTWAVREIVHFGDRWPTVASPVIEELRAGFGDHEVRVIPEEFQPGDRVRVAGGPLQGLEAVVSRAIPGKQRVAILLDFLGRHTPVEVSVSLLVSASESRAGLFSNQPEPAASRRGDLGHSAVRS